MQKAWTVSNTEYTALQLLGKGKGGYSYLVTDGLEQYVLKQIHHEPCEYYTFSDKLKAELRDYETLRRLGIPMPELLAVDERQERLLKQYIAGPTAAELLNYSSVQYFSKCFKDEYGCSPSTYNKLGL